MFPRCRTKVSQPKIFYMLGFIDCAFNRFSLSRWSHVAGITLLMAACSGTTKVIETDPGSYRVTSHAAVWRSSGSAQKTKAYEIASAYCKAKGKHVETLNSFESPRGLTQKASGEVDFRCN
jgi:hypothetical protein